MKKFAIAFALFVAAGSASAQSLGEALGNYQAQLQNDATDKFCDQLKRFGGFAAEANKKGMSRYKVKDTLSKSFAQQSGVTPMLDSVNYLGRSSDNYVGRFSDNYLPVRTG